MTPPSAAPPTAPTLIITGAARRVGLATATVFARAGWNIVATFNRSREEAAKATFALQNAAKSVGHDHLTVEFHELDLDNLAAVEQFGATIANRRSTIDALVHNASLYSPTPLATLSPDDLLRNFRINAAAPMLLSKHLAPRLADSTRPGGGGIVAMCDIHALGEHGLPRKDFAAYAMSKAALAELVRTLARELAPRVRVNGVAPGVVAFPEQGYESDPAMQEAYLKRVPLGRSGTPEDAAELVRWLVMDANYLTGQIIRLDGGRSML